MMIEIEKYLEAISTDNVCGVNLNGDADFLKLEKDIKGKPEDYFAQTKAEPPNWRDIKKQSEALLERSIDLRVLIFYLRALIALEGFSGAQDGLTLMASLIEKRWETLHPQLDPDDNNDPTERINILLSLCNRDITLLPLQQMPLLESKQLGRFNLRQISIASGKSTATDKEQAVSQATIDAAIQDCEIADLQETLQCVTLSLEQVDKLENRITDYVGMGEAPSFADLRTLLKECTVFLKTSLESKGANTPQNPATEEHGSDQLKTTSTPEKPGLGVINNNQDVIKTLNQVCDYYRKNEPSSPLPLLLERAIRLVGKSFVDVLNDIAPAGMDEAKIVFGKQPDES